MQYNNLKDLTGFDWLNKSIQLASCYGIDEYKKSEPLADIKAMNANFDTLEKFCRLLKNNGSHVGKIRLVLSKMRNIRGSLENISNSSVPDEVELFEIKSFCIQYNDLGKLFKTCAELKEEFAFDDFTPVIKQLNPDSVVTPTFYLHNSYSDKLQKLRTLKRDIEKQILKAAESEKKQLFIKRSELVAEEQAEELVVRQRLGKFIEQWVEKLLFACNIAGIIDLFIAKAMLARRYQSCIPQINKDYNCAIELEEAINPSISEMLESKDRKFTPITLNVQKGITILTGANMGGKTVALKTFAFNIQLARLGFKPFASKCVMPLVGFVLFNGGDRQSEKRGLSSFGAEIIELDNFCELVALKKTGLVIFDEFAATTNPYEGYRFVMALCEYISESGSYGIIATHYDNIAFNNASYYQVSGLKADAAPLDSGASKEQILKRLSEQMDYRLIKRRSPPAQDAQRIARLLNVNQRFLNLLSKQYLKS